MMAAVSADEMVAVRDDRTWEQVTSFVCRSGWLLMEMSLDGRTLILGGVHGVRVIDSLTGQCAWEWRQEPRKTSSIAISPSGDLLACTNDDLVSVVDLCGACECTSKVAGHAAVCARFSSCGSMLVVCREGISRVLAISHG